MFPGSTRFGLRFSDASWLGPVRFGSVPRPVPAGSRIQRFGSVRPVRFGSVSYSFLHVRGSGSGVVTKSDVHSLMGEVSRANSNTTATTTTNNNDNDNNDNDDDDNDNKHNDNNHHTTTTTTTTTNNNNCPRLDVVRLPGWTRRCFGCRARGPEKMRTVIMTHSPFLEGICQNIDLYIIFVGLDPQGCAWFVCVLVNRVDIHACCRT